MNQELQHFPDIDKALVIDTDAVRKHLVQFIRQELGRAGFNRVVLGLSGGLDSALAAFLAAEALEPANVLALWMPYRTSDPASEADARKVIEQLHVATETVDISPMADAFFERTPELTRRRRGNVMARMRMITLFDRSVAWNGLVLGTSNKTEIWLGYGTMYGDVASGLNPLGDLYKTQVRQLARAMGVPASIISKPPSADLWAGQTDEGEIGFPYTDLDRVLHLLVDRGFTVPQATLHGLPAELVEAVARIIRSTAFKRRLPTIASLP